MGEVSSPVSGGLADFPVVGATLNSEMSVAYVPGAGPQSCAPGIPCAKGRWVGVANGDDNTSANRPWSWMYSTDGNANSWTFATQVNWNDFGCPGANGTQGAGCPGQPSPFGATYSFGGVLSDHSVAAVTDQNGWKGGPSTNPNLWKSTVVGTFIAFTSSPGNPSNNEPVVMLSLDGGATWGNGTNPPNPTVPSTMQWLDTGSSDGGSIDMPFVFSNPESPYDTYASWNTRSATPTGFLRQIKYDLSTTPYPTANLGNFSIAVPRSTADNQPTCGTNSTGGLPGSTPCEPSRFNFAFSQLPGSPCASGNEGIIVTWATLPSGSSVACGNSPTGYGTVGAGYGHGSDMGTVSWNIAIYDTGCTNSGGTSGCWLTLLPQLRRRTRTVKPEAAGTSR